jgi:hypothetical protein
METEGTYILSGIIQGQLPPGPDGRERLERFNAKLADSGLVLSLRVDGPNFSLLASDSPVETEVVSAAEFEAGVESALGSLLEVFPEAMRMSLMSTIRSRVYLGAREHQAVYAVVFPGVIKVQTAAVKADLLPRPRRLSTKMKVLFVAIVGVALALAFWASTIWVDYRPAGRQLTLMLKGNKLEDIRLNVGALGDVVKVEKLELSSLRKVISLKVSRGAGWSSDPSAANAAAGQLHEALFVRRYLKVTFIDAGGNVVVDREGKLLERVLRVADLRSADSVESEVLLPDGLPIAEITIAP